MFYTGGTKHTKFNASNLSRSAKSTWTLTDGDSGFEQLQQGPVQGAEEGEPQELDRVPLQLVHCSCHDHTWGQGLDPLTGCPFATLIYYNNNKNRQLLVPNGI